MPEAADETDAFVRTAIHLAIPPTLCFLAFLFPVVGTHDLRGFVTGRDFANFWLGGHLALEGRIAELYDLEAYLRAMRRLLAPASPFMNFSYLPNVLPLLIPLALLPYHLALALWTAGGLAAFCAAATGGLRPAGLARAAMISPAALLTVMMGQASLLLAGLFVGGFRLLDRHPRLVGVMFGLFSVKPQLALVLPIVLAAQRRWLTMAYAALTAAALLGLSLALFGVAPWLAYTGETLSFQRYVMTELDGLAGALLVTPYAFLHTLGLRPDLAMAGHAVVAAGVAAATYLLARRSQDMSRVAVAAALAAMVLSPYGMAYDLVIPAAALVWHLSSRGEGVGRNLRLVLGLFMALPALAVFSAPFGFRAIPVIALALFVIVAREGLGRPAAPAVAAP